MLHIEYLCKNLKDEGEYVPIIVGEYYSLSPCSTNSKEYEFNSLSEATTNKDIDQVYVYENQIKVGETSRVRLDGSNPTNFLESSIASVSTQKHLNTPLDEVVIGLELLVQALNDYIGNAIKPFSTLSLTHPELIDWNPNASRKFPTFQSDYALAYYLNVVKLVTSSTNE